MKKFHQRHHDSTFSALTALFLICHPSRDLKPHVSGCPRLIIYHSALVHGQQSCSLFLNSLPFILRPKYQYCSHCSKQSESKVPLAISSEYIRIFQLSFLFTLTLSHLKRYIHIKVGYPLILKRLKKAFRYCGLTFNGTYRFDFHFIPSSFQSFIFNATYLTPGLFKIWYAEWCTNY